MIFDILMCSIALIQHLEHMQMREIHIVVNKNKIIFSF